MSYGRSRAESCKAPECKAWCGLLSMDDAVPVGLGGNDGPGWFTDSFGYGRDAEEPIRAWCSAACRAERLPPVADRSQSCADKAARVEPAQVERIGKRYRRPGGRVATIVSSPAVGMWKYEPADNNSDIVAELWLAANWVEVAEPAKYPERRPGQRWEYKDSRSFVLARPISIYPNNREVWEDTDGMRWVGWDIEGCMTLVADVPAEGKASEDVVDALGYAVSDLARAGFDPGSDDGVSVTVVCRACKTVDGCKCKTAPAAKAAKAPVCEVKYGVSGCFGEVLSRRLQGVTKPLLCCETCMIARESVLAKMTKSTGTPCAAPAGLMAKPKMAHVAGMHDEELTTWSGR